MPTATPDDRPAAPTAVPDLPASELGPLVVGLGPLLEDAGDALAQLGIAGAARVGRAVGSTYTVEVTADGITAKALLRRHTVRWADARELVLEPVSATAARRLIGGGARRVVGRSVWVPGLRQLAGLVVDRVADLGADAVAGLPLGLPEVVVEVRGRRGEVALDGPLALAALLCPQLTRTAVLHAEAHGVPLVRST